MDYLEIVKCNRNNPEKAAQVFEKAPVTNTAMQSLKTAATRFLKSPGVKRFGIAGAVGAAIGAVKEFNNNDPTTYLSNEDQQKICWLTWQQILLQLKWQRPDILDYQLPDTWCRGCSGNSSLQHLKH